MHITLENIGIAVRQKRGNRSLREIAAETDISVATLSRIEVGKMPSLRTFAKLCRWLGIDPTTVLDVEPTKSAPPAPPIIIHIDATTRDALANAIVQSQLMLNDRPYS